MAVGSRPGQGSLGRRLAVALCIGRREMRRRRAVIEALLNEASLDHLVYCGANRFGSAVQWLTGWPVTAEAVGVFTPGRPDVLFIQHVNHVPLARLLAAPAEVNCPAAS